MSDFSPEVRNAAIWSGDSRKIATGHAAAVVLEKLGRTEPEDLSEEEHVQMGHILQPVISRIFSQEHGVHLKDADYALTHPQHPWLRSHFDYVAADNSFLVECKNYNAAYITAFSEPDDPVRVPDADYAQCLHEAIAHNVDTVWLAVLFGGQRYRDFCLTFAAEEKDKWIQRLAEVWGNVQTQTIPPAASPDEAREIWPQDDSHSIVASKQIEALCLTLARYTAQHKQNEEAIEGMKTQIMNFMGARSVLTSLDGRTLAAWKTAKGSKRFSSDLLKSSMPDIYEKFCVDMMGSRRFLVKG